MLISSAVSQRSRISSTMRAKGLRTANDFARAWPSPVAGLRDLVGVAGCEVGPDDVDEEGFDAGPIGRPLYSGIAPRAGLLSPDPARLLCASNASSTLTMAWRCSARASWLICTSSSALCSCTQRSECFSNHQGTIERSQTRQRIGSGGGWLAGSLPPASASSVRYFAKTSAPTPSDSIRVCGKAIVIWIGSAAGCNIHIVYQQVSEQKIHDRSKILTWLSPPEVRS